MSRKIAAALVVIAVATIFTLGAIRFLGTQQTDACHDVNALRLVLIQLVNRGAKNTPKLAYYTQHPAELRAVEAQIAQERIVLAPVKC